jgi:acyl-CoA synthetase (AMP-forming)/AMP-acid ligase II
MVLETLQHLAQTLATHGDRPAIVALGKEDAKVWSFATLVDHARRLASGLTAAGLPRGAHVVLFAPNRPEWIVAIASELRKLTSKPHLPLQLLGL